VLICVVLQRLQLLVAVTMQLKFVIYVPKLVISMSISTVKTVLTNAENALTYASL
jgi:hypothetical protein